jgi:hypothetical protein
MGDCPINGGWRHQRAARSYGTLPQGKKRRAFSVGGATDATAGMASKGRQCTMADCDSPARFFLRRNRF